MINCLQKHTTNKKAYLLLKQLTGGNSIDLNLMKKIIEYYQLPDNENFRKIIVLQDYYRSCTKIMNINNFLKSWFIDTNRNYWTFSLISVQYKSTDFLNMNKILITLSTKNMVANIDSYLDIDTLKYLTQPFLDIQNNITNNITNNNKNINLNLTTKRETNKNIRYFMDNIVSYFLLHLYFAHVPEYHTMYFNQAVENNMKYWNLDKLDDESKHKILDFILPYLNAETFPDKDAVKNVFSNLDNLQNEATVAMVSNNSNINDSDIVVNSLLKCKVFNKCIIDLPRYNESLILYRCVNNYDGQLLKQTVESLNNDGYIPVYHFLSCSLVPFSGGGGSDGGGESRTCKLYFKINVPPNFPLYFLSGNPIKLNGIMNNEHTEVVVPYCNNDFCDEITYKLTKRKYIPNHTTQFLSINNKTSLESMETMTIDHYFEVDLDLLSEVNFVLDKPIKLKYYNEIMDSYKYKSLTEHDSVYLQRYNSENMPSEEIMNRINFGTEMDIIINKFL